MNVAIQRRHLLFLIPSLRGGGAERVVVTLLRHLDRRRFRLSLAVVDMRDAVYRDDLPLDVELIDLRSQRVRGAVLKIASLIWRVRPDLVFSTLGHLNLALAALRTFLPNDVRYFARETTVVSRMPSAFNLPGWWAWAYRRFYSRFDTIICQSCEMRDDLIKQFGIPREKTAVINNPVDLERITRQCADPTEMMAFPPPSAAVRLVAAGSMTYVKGFDILLEALQRCHERDYHLTLLGDGPLLAQLKQIAVEKGLAARVSFLGFKKNPYPYFRAADGFVLSSRFEGFPNVVLESLACGTPVIAVPSSGGIREILTTIDGCILAEDCSPEALARALMGFGGKERVSPHVLLPYTVGTIVGRYEQLFLDSLKEKASSSAPSSNFRHSSSMRPERELPRTLVSVLHVINCLDVGGAEVALKKLILADPSGPERHVVVSLTTIGPVGRQLGDAGVAVHALCMRRISANLRGFVRLVRLIRQYQPTVIQTWLYHGDLVGGLAARVAGRREIIWGVHNTRFVRGQSKMTIGVMKLCAFVSSWVPRVIVCCADAARISHVGWGYRPENMRVIPNGFDLPDTSVISALRNASREELGIEGTGVVIGIVARFDPTKDHRVFIEAAGAIAGANPTVKFMLVGRGIDHSNLRLTEWIRAAGIEGRCLLLGERGDIQKCFAAMDVFCLSSIHEAFPLVIGEAMAMGLPCVVTDAGDAARIVGETGWVVPPRNPVELAKALSTVVAMTGCERKAAGLAARQRIGAEFGMANTFRLFEQAYLDACVRNRG